MTDFSLPITIHRGTRLLCDTWKRFDGPRWRHRQRSTVTQFHYPANNNNSGRVGWRRRRRCRRFYRCCFVGVPRLAVSFPRHRKTCHNRFSRKPFGVITRDRRASAVRTRTVSKHRLCSRKTRQVHVGLDFSTTSVSKPYKLRTCLLDVLGFFFFFRKFKLTFHGTN